jgi:hypothetical protein
MALIDLGSNLNTVPTSGSCVHLIHTYYNKNNGHSIPNVAIVGLEKNKGFYESPGGKPENGEFPHMTAAREMLEELSIHTTKKNITLVANRLKYIGSRLNQDKRKYTHHFALNLVGYSTTNKVYPEHVEFRHVPIVNMDTSIICDVHGKPLKGTVKGMNIAAIKVAKKMSLDTIHISELD